MADEEEIIDYIMTMFLHDKETAQLKSYFLENLLDFFETRKSRILIY